MKYVIPLILALPAVGFADRDLVDVRDKGLDISCHQISEQSGAVQCSVQQRNMNLIDVFQIADPARLVMDLAERPKGISHKQTASDSSILSGVRTGWHPDKYRIVFDLNPDKKISYTWRQDKNTVFLEVTPEGAATTAAIPSPEINVARRMETDGMEQTSPALHAVKTSDLLPEEPASPLIARSSVQSAETVSQADAPTPPTPDCTNPGSDNCIPTPSDLEEERTVIARQEIEDSVEPEAKKLTVVRPTELSKVAVVRNVIPAPKNEAPTLIQRQEVQAETIVESDGEEENTTVRARMNPDLLEKQDPVLEGQVLHGISFSSSSDSENPIVHLKLTEKPHFNLSKLGPRTYRLRVLRCNIQDESLSLPFFPPHTFPRVSFLQAESGTDKVEITIGVERGTRLMAVSSDNGIDIKVIG